MRKLEGSTQPQEYTEGPPPLCNGAKSRRMELLTRERALGYGTWVSFLLSCGIRIPPSFDISVMCTVPRELSFIMAWHYKGKNMASSMCFSYSSCIYNFLRMLIFLETKYLLNFFFPRYTGVVFVNWWTGNFDLNSPRMVNLHSFCAPSAVPNLYILGHVICISILWPCSVLFHSFFMVRLFEKCFHDWIKSSFDFQLKTLTLFLQDIDFAEIL